MILDIKKKKKEAAFCLGYYKQPSTNFPINTRNSSYTFTLPISVRSSW